MLGSILIEQYAGDVDAVLRLHAEHWPAYAGSQLNRVEIVRNEALSLEAGVMLVAARAGDASKTARARNENLRA